MKAVVDKITEGKDSRMERWKRGGKKEEIEEKEEEKEKRRRRRGGREYIFESLHSSPPFGSPGRN